MACRLEECVDRIAARARLRAEVNPSPFSPPPHEAVKPIIQNQNRSMAPDAWIRNQTKGPRTRLVS